jgi:hypothetical protein
MLVLWYRIALVKNPSVSRINPNVLEISALICLSDAREICECLKNNGDFEIPTDQLLVGPHATRRKILKAISRIFRNEDFKCDLVTFYFGGHGIVSKNKADNKNEGYIAPYDMDPDDPYVNSINLEELKTVISTSQNGASVTMFLDSCFAGIAAQGVTRQYGILDIAETRNLYVTKLKNMVESPNQSANLFNSYVKNLLAVASVQKNDFDLLTPFDVMFAKGKARLLHYYNSNSGKDITTKHHHHQAWPMSSSLPESPVLVLYAPVNRFHIMDISPDRSVVRALLSRGLDVYLLDWGYPECNDSFVYL